MLALRGLAGFVVHPAISTTTQLPAAVSRFPSPVSRLPLPVSRFPSPAMVSSASTRNSPPSPAPLKKTVQNLLAEYGTVAVIVYFTIFFAVLGGFWLAIRFGWRPTSAAGTAGTFAAAYIATKLTQPIRIAATLVVTPLVAKLYERARGRSGAAPNDEAKADS